MELHQKLATMAVNSMGLSLVPKLKLEHIQLTSFSRMRVDLATQVSKMYYNYSVLCML